MNVYVDIPTATEGDGRQPPTLLPDQPRAQTKEEVWGIFSTMKQCPFINL